MLGGSGRDVIAYEIYTSILTYHQLGTGAALAVLLLASSVAIMMVAGTLTLALVTTSEAGLRASRRAGDSANALQLSDAVTSALTTGLAGVLVAAAARGVFGYTAAFTVLDLAMAAIAMLGVAVAGRAGPPSGAVLVTSPAV